MKMQRQDILDMIKFKFVDEVLDYKRQTPCKMKANIEIKLLAVYQQAKVLSIPCFIHSTQNFHWLWLTITAKFELFVKMCGWPNGIAWLIW